MACLLSGRHDYDRAGTRERARNMNDDLTAKAEAIGREHGQNAASWVFDGNTTQATYRKVLKGIDAGDPAVYNAYRSPGLSGEFTDEYTENALMADIGFSDASLDAEEDYDDAVSEYADAYTDAAAESFWSEIERVCRYQLSDNYS